MIVNELRKLMRILDSKAKPRMHFVHLEALALAGNSVQLLKTLGKVIFLLKFLNVLLT